METKDHYSLSKNLADSMELGKVNKLSFIWGNLIPDINPFSYIASIGSSRFSGHSFSSRKSFMKKVLEKRYTGTPLWWYRTGKMLHYLADSFTRPHNEKFQYSLKAHMEYEHQLHQVLASRLNKNIASKPLDKAIPPQLSSTQLEEEHASYMKECLGPGDDCRYILQTAAAACRLTLAANRPGRAAEAVLL